MTTFDSVYSKMIFSKVVGEKNIVYWDIRPHYNNNNNNNNILRLKIMGMKNNCVYGLNTSPKRGSTLKENKCLLDV